MMAALPGNRLKLFYPAFTQITSDFFLPVQRHNIPTEGKTLGLFFHVHVIKSRAPENVIVVQSSKNSLRFVLNEKTLIDDTLV